MGQVLVKDKAEKTIEGVLKAYESHLKSREIRSRKEYLAQIRIFLTWCEKEGIPPLELKEDQAQGWIISLLEGNPPMHRRTINFKLAILKGFYSFLQKRGIIPISPWFYLRSLKQSKTLPRDIPKPSDLEKLFREFSVLTLDDEMLKTIMEILYGSGLRISEVKELHLEDVDWSSGSLTIFERKTQRYRKAPATEAALRAIQQYHGEVRQRLLSTTELQAGFLFPQQGESTLRSQVNRRLKRECSRLGLPALTSHSFRHAAATHMLRSGAGIRQVQEFLGHRSISSTEVYTHLIKEDLKAVIHDHHPRERRKTWNTDPV